MRPSILTVILSVIALSACSYLAADAITAHYDENYRHVSPGAYLKALQRSRRHMYDTPHKYDEPYTFGMLVHELISRRLSGSAPGLEKEDLIGEAIGYIDRAVTRVKDAGGLAALHVLKYDLLVDSGDRAQALRSLRASLRAYPGGPALRPLLEYLVRSGHRNYVPVWCKYERSVLRSADELDMLCRICAQYGDRLRWLSANDRQYLGYTGKTIKN
jgi:hypothetical protein